MINTAIVLNESVAQNVATFQTRAIIQRARDIIARAETKLGTLDEAQRRDLLADNTNWSTDRIREIVVEVGAPAPIGHIGPNSSMLNRDKGFKMFEVNLNKSIEVAPNVDYKAQDLLSEWSSVVRELEHLKNTEMRLRKALVDSLWQGEKLRGSQTQALPNGWKLELGKNQNYNVAKEAAPGIHSSYPEVVKPRYEVSASKYEALSQIDKNLLQDFITITDGAPTLKLIGPKE